MKLLREILGVVLFHQDTRSSLGADHFTLGRGGYALFKRQTFFLRNYTRQLFFEQNSETIFISGLRKCKFFHEWGSLKIPADSSAN